MPLFAAAGFAEGFFAAGFCAAGLVPLVGVDALAASCAGFFAAVFAGFFAAVLAAAGAGVAGCGEGAGRVADVSGCVGCFVVGFVRLKGRGNIDFKRFFTTHSTNEHPGH